MNHTARTISAVLSIAVAMSLPAEAAGVLRGQFKGQSRVTDQKSTAATSLDASGDQGRLRIEGDSRCSIKGSLQESSSGEGCWTLSPTDVRGGGQCEAMSKGTVTICESGGHGIRLSATYRFGDSDQQRIGALSHYP